MFWYYACITVTCRFSCTLPQLNQSIILVVIMTQYGHLKGPIQSLKIEIRPETKE